MYLNNKASLKIISQTVLLFSCMLFSALSSAENVKTGGEGIFQNAYGQGYTTDGKFFNVAGTYSLNAESSGTYESRTVSFYLDGLGFFYQEVNASDLIFDIANASVSINAVVGGYPVSVTFTGDQKYTKTKNHNFAHGTGIKFHGHSTGLINANVTVTGTIADSIIDVTDYAVFEAYRSSWKQVQK